MTTSRAARISPEQLKRNIRWRVSVSSSDSSILLDRVHIKTPTSHQPPSGMEVKGESQNIRPNPKPVGSACALCRKRKRKCDESVPCRHCKKANTLCERPPAPFRSACVACRELHGKCNKGVRSCQYCKNANILCVRLKAQDSEPSKSEDMAPLREEAHHSGQPRSVVLTSPGIGRSVGTDHQKSSMTDIVTLTPLVVHLPTPSNTPRYA